MTVIVAETHLFYKMEEAAALEADATAFMHFGREITHMGLRFLFDILRLIAIMSTF